MPEHIMYTLTSIYLHPSGVRYQDFYFDIISIRYWGKYRNFDTIFDNFNCVGGVIAWATYIYKYA